MGIRFNAGGVPIEVTDTVTTVDPTSEIRFTSVGSVTNLGSGVAQVDNTGGLAIGDVVGGGTVGSVLYIGIGSILQQDNPDFFYNESQGFLGLGVGSPTRRLDLGGGAGSNTIALTSGADPTRFLTITATSTQQIVSTNDLIIESGCSTEIRIGGGLPNCEFTLCDAQAANQKFFQVDAQLAGFLLGKGVGYADTVANAQANSFFMEGFLAVGTPIPQANTKVNFVGDNVLATDYALSVESSLSNLLSLRNDGEVSIGRDAGKNGISNIFAGDRAGGNIVAGGGGVNNSGFGFSAVREISTGTDNTGVGYQSLISCNIGRANTAVGSNCLNNVTSGRFNIAIGSSTDTVTQTGQNNITIGANLNTTGALATDELNIGDIVKGRMGATAEVQLACRNAAPAMPQDNNSVIFYEDAGNFKADYVNGAGVLTTFTLA